MTRRLLKMAVVEQNVTLWASLRRWLYIRRGLPAQTREELPRSQTHWLLQQIALGLVIMTNRKAEEEKAARKPTKSRKRYAFTTPNASTNAMYGCLSESIDSLLMYQLSIARNASTSPLLRLPLEIRNNIYTEVLRNRLIHLRYLYGDDVSFETNEEMHRITFNSSPWRGLSRGSRRREVNF